MMDGSDTGGHGAKGCLAAPFHYRPLPPIMRTMEIFIDGHPVDLACRDLDGALDAAAKHLSPRGRIVVEVEADGRDLVGEDLEHERAAGAAPACLNLLSADPRDLVEVALEEVRQGLVEAQRLQVEAAELLQKDNLPAAMENIGEAVDHWQDLQKVVVQAGSLLANDIGMIRVGEVSVEETVVALAERLKDLRMLLGAGDTVAVADELMYVWPDLCERWDQTLAAIIEVVQEDPSPVEGKSP